MRHWDALRLEDFLAAHPRIRILEINDERLVLAGEYHLRAQLAGSQLVDRTYRLKLVFLRDYPEKLPTVIDKEKYFPRNQEYHTYDDGSFCLGSELKIKSLLKDDLSLSAFFVKIVDGFLYAVTHRIEYGNFPYGELAHGERLRASRLHQGERGVHDLGAVEARAPARSARSIPCGRGRHLEQCARSLGHCASRTPSGQDEGEEPWGIRWLGSTRATRRT